MSNLAITYQHIADILSFKTSNLKLEKNLNHHSFDWDAIVVEGSKHLVLPAIYCQLKSKQLLHILPEELIRYLEEITSINRNRNEAILRQVISISQIFNKHNINYVFLKGSALLALNSFNDKAERMVGDIDILICKTQLQKAFKLLQDNGYNKGHGFAYETIDFRHLDRLVSKKEIAAVELHEELIIPKYRYLIDAKEILNSKYYINNISVPSTFYLSKHQILGWQINNKGHFFYGISFKSFYDSIVLKVYSNEILMSDLKKLKFGKSYLALGKHYFKGFDNIPFDKKMKFHCILHQKYLNNLFFKFALKPIKHYYIYIEKRTKLVLNNKFYRMHLVKKIFIAKK